MMFTRALLAHGIVSEEQALLRTQVLEDPA